MSHPVRVSDPQETERGQPREPAASSHCSLPPRPPSGAPDGPPSGSSTGSRRRHPRRSQCGARLADSARRLTTGDTAPAGRVGARALRPERGPDAGAPTVRVEAVFSRLLTPKWLLLHVLVAVLFVATFFLGYWQLTKAEAGGGAVNWSYALQWPLYGFMGLWFYLRMVRDRAAPRPRRRRAGQSTSSCTSGRASTRPATPSWPPTTPTSPSSTSGRSASGAAPMAADRTDVGPRLRAGDRARRCSATGSWPTSSASC